MSVIDTAVCGIAGTEYSVSPITNHYYYLFKKFLVSDWLTANCEIVISTQWLTKDGFFTFIIAK